MDKRFVLFFGLGLVLLLTSCGINRSTQTEFVPTNTVSADLSPTQTPTPQKVETKVPVETAQAVYAHLLEQMKKQDPDLDFAALRLAYSQTEAYNPYGGEEDDLIEAMWTAVDASDFNQALDLANQALALNEVSPRAHTGAYYAYDGLGKKAEAKYHRYVASGIIDSILASGDGKSPETAYVVIAVPEEYVLLSVLGVKVDLQQWDEIEGHNYDFFNVVDKKTNEKSMIYFNIDIPWDWLSEQLQ